MKRVGILIILVCCLLPWTAQAGDPYIHCHLYAPGGETVPIYAKASTKSKKVGDFYSGPSVSWDSWEEDDSDGWVYLDGDYPIGYVQTKYLVDELPDELTDADGDSIATFPQLEVSSDTSLRERPSSKAEEVNRLPSGMKLIALGDCGDYWFVSIQGMFFQKGFVAKADVRTTGASVSESEPLVGQYEAQLYPSDPLINVPIYNTPATENLDQEWSPRSVWVGLSCGDWTLIASREDGPYWLWVESRFLDPNGDHSLPVAYTSTDRPADRLLLRSQPKKSDQYDGKFFSGVPVVILAQKGDWSDVRFGNINGWFMTSYLTAQCSEDGRVQAQVTEDLTVQSVGPGLTRRYVSSELTLKKGDTVLLIGSAYDDMIYLAPSGEAFAIPIQKLMPVEDSGVLQAKTTSRLKMRGPDLDKDDDTVIRSLAKGVKVKVLLHGDVWSKIEYDGDVGYVMTKYLKF